MDYTLYQGRGTNKSTGVARPITYLPNTSEWVEQIYALAAESSGYSADKVLGGVDGIANAPIQALANRTYFLKDYIVRIATVLNAIQVALAPTLKTVKALKYQPGAVDDPDHEALLKLTVDLNGKDMTVDFENGTYVVNPILELTLENGNTFYLRTDGLSSIVPNINTFLNSTASEG